MATLETMRPLAERQVEWAPVFAGAVTAAALAMVMLAFGAAIGLSMTSPWPGSGVSLLTTTIFVTYWTVMIQILSFAAGGYLAARLRAPAIAADQNRSFRDGAHGLLVWGVGVLFMAAVAAMGGSLAVQSVSTIASGAAAGTGATVGRNGPSLVNPSEYAVDLLLRPVPGATPPAGQPGQSTASDDAALRGELGRLFGATVRNRELTVRDRDYLAQLVATRTGASPADAQRRVGEAVAEARDLEIKAREQADKARKGSIFAAFTAAASLLISLAAACAAATFGGKQRDDNTPFHIWGRPVW